MIRHRPDGRGHPYLIEPDQRVPDSAGCGRDRRVARDDAGRDRERPRGDRDRRRRDHDRGQAARAGSPGGRRRLRRHRSARRRGPPERRRGPARRTARPQLLGGGAAAARGRPGAALPLRGRRGAHALVRGDRVQPGSPTAAIYGSSRSSSSRASGSSPRASRGSRAAAWPTGSASPCGWSPGERVVGFGERFDGLDQRGRLVDCAVFDQYKGQGARTYLPMPFAIVVGGEFGFHVDTGRRVRFDVGHSDPDLILVEVDLEPGRAGGGAPDYACSPELRTGCLRTSSTRRAGRQAPPPDWIYRLWMSGNEWNTQARVLEEVRRSEHEGIPVGAIVIEAWSDEETFVSFNGAQYDVHPDGSPHRLADFHFPADGPWPDPKGMVDDLHARGIRVLLWQIPLVYANRGQARADRATMVARRYCVHRADGKPYRNRGWWFPGALLADFTNPDARRWWTEKRRYLLEELGVDGFKTDGGEHAWGTDLRYADGTHGGETNNRYPVLYGDAYHVLMRSTGRDADHLQPSRFHRLSRRSVPLGRRRGLHLGGLPSLDLGRAERRRERHLLLELGPGRLLRPGAECRALPPLGRDGGAVPDHAIPLRVQPPPSTLARPDAMERRRATRRCQGDSCLPSLRPFAGAPRALSRRAGRALTRQRQAADARVVLRGRRRPSDLGFPARSTSSATISSSLP